MCNITSRQDSGSYRLTQMPRSRRFSSRESLWPPVLRKAYPPLTVSREVAYWKTSKSSCDPVGTLYSFKCYIPFPIWDACVS